MEVPTETPAPDTAAASETGEIAAPKKRSRKAPKTEGTGSEEPGEPPKS